MDNSSLYVSELSCIRRAQLIFSKLQFEVLPGELLVITGENGSGKSSLLRILAGIATPASGTLTWGGKEIAMADYQSQLHYLNHTNGIKLGLTINENLQMAARLLEQTLHKQSMRQELESLQLLPYQDIQASYLSAGQKRRIALSKLFLISKKLWILDEPLTSLDTQTQQYFYTKLKRHLNLGGMAVMSSHHPVDLQNVVIKKIRIG